MEVRSRILQSTTLLTHLSRPNLVEKRFCKGQFPKFCNPKQYPGSRKLQLVHIRAQQSSGARRFSSTAVETTSENVNLKDNDVVFVAGATGRVGSRTVRELLKLGFRVRAGVRSAQRAENLLRSVREMKLDTDTTGGLQPIEKLEIVECDLEKRDRIIPALGRASVVICCIGASEKEIFDVTGPYRIDYLATKNLIDAATIAKVNHFILLTSLGTNKVGFPAAILNLFWGVLIWKRKAEEALIDSGLPYTIVRPGGMERPTDSFKETHNMTLSQEDTLFGGLVSNLQVAELMAFMAQNRDLSYCKVVEVVAETTAPLTPMGELLVKIPSKRDDLYKTETSEAAERPEPSPPKSTVTQAATISEKEPTEEKSVELDAPTQKPDAEPAKNSISEVPTVLTEKETVEDSSVAPRPLSPYTVYEDLKPPTSPSPSPPGNSRNEPVETSKTVDGVQKVIDGTLMENIPQEIQESTFYLSPYPVYDDLKPPTSPTPTAPNSSPNSMASADVESISATTSSNEAVEPGKAEKAGDEHKSSWPKAKPLSPYTMYDLKPPTSPTPTSPNSSSTSTAFADADSQIAAMSSNEAVEPVTAEKGGDEQIPPSPKLRPLSPYTMYDDLKPPTSPMPSPRNC